MAFPSTQGSRNSLSEAWESARGVAGAVKSAAQNLRSKLSGNVTSGDVLNQIAGMAGLRVALQKSALVPGIAAYAQAQIGDNTVDIVAEFNTMLAKLDAVVAWVVTIFPKDGSGFLLAQTIGNDGRTADRTFAPAATAGLGTALDDLIAAID